MRSATLVCFHGNYQSTRKEAHLIALRCSEPPAGQVTWTLRLLADTLVSSRWSTPFLMRLCVTQYTKRIEAALAGLLVYSSKTPCGCCRPDGRCVGCVVPSYHSARPVICMDEQPVQSIEEVRLSLSASSGKPARYDYEYIAVCRRQSNGKSRPDSWSATDSGDKHVCCHVSPPCNILLINSLPTYDMTERLGEKVKKSTNALVYKVLRLYNRQ